MSYQGQPDFTSYNNQRHPSQFPSQAQQPYIYQPQQIQPPLFGHPPKEVVETKYLVTRNGPLGTQSQANAAATFFARSHQRHPTKTSSNHSSPLTSRRQRQPGGGSNSRLSGNDSSEERDQFPTNFRGLVQRFPPLVPNTLLRKLEVVDPPQGMGKIRVVLRVTKPSSAAYQYSAQDPGSGRNPHQHFEVDLKRKQVTLYDPAILRGQNGNSDVAIEERKIGVAAPKMFAFDGMFTSDDTQEDLCGAALPDVIHSVLNGNDGCLFCFGHANLGKTRTMLGSDQCAKDMGVIPITIAWVYKAIKERKTKMGSRFSVRVSALEITGQRESVRDLLAPYNNENDESPAVYLRQLPIMGSCMQNQSELRASSAEKAAYYLDAALAGRSLDAQGRESHLIFTLHIYQYSVSGQGGMLGGRSRLHLIDFGGCERTKTPGGGITLSGLGNVILGIFNGQKHLPHRDSKVTQVLRECLGSLTCQATMLAHVSPEPSHYSETLHTIQLASRLHRLRRKRMKAHSSSGSTCSDEHRRLSKLRSHRSGSSGRSSSDLTSGTSTNASSSEMSCDTVVYRGHSDGSGTDSEHPPIFLGSRMASGGSSGGSSAPGSLRGSLDEIPRPLSGASRRKKILTNGVISPRRNLSPQPQIARSPHRSLSSLPVIHEVNTHSGKMPLNGLVPVQGRQHRQIINHAHHHNNHYQQQQQQQQQQIQRLAHPEQWIDVNPNYKTQSQSVFSTRKEVWIDQPSSSSPALSSGLSSHPYPLTRSPAVLSNPPKLYGYMDEHKANMITTWVENQTQAHGTAEDLTTDRGQVLDNNRNVSDNQSQNVFQALTQFKTCDSDEGAEHKVIIHHQPPPPSAPSPPPLAPPLDEAIGEGDNLCRTAPKPTSQHQPKQQYNNNSNNNSNNSSSSNARQFQGGHNPPPPPPPRRTPPRTTANFNDLVNECNKLAGHFDMNSMNQNAILPSPFDTPSSRELDLQHPLRILSEENLTIVSSFAGSKDDLRSNGENDLDEECDPSKLSFFQVPDFNSIKDDMEKQDNFISERFREFAQLEKECHSSNQERSANDERPNHQDHHHRLTFAPAPSSGTKNAPNDVQLHFIPRNVNNNNSSPENEERHVAPMPHDRLRHPSNANLRESVRMSPQKQFEMLAQSLRHPDGSSNPELHVIEKTMISVVANPSRSPGNGRSSSDLEDENLNHPSSSCRPSSSRTETTTDSVNGNSFVPAKTSTLCNEKSMIGNSSVISGVAKSQLECSKVNATTHNNDDVDNRAVKQRDQKTPKTSNPPKKERFGFRFLRIFGSSRKLNNNNNQKGRQDQAQSNQGERRSKSCDRGASNQIRPLVGGNGEPHASNNNGSSNHSNGRFLLRDGGFFRASMRGASSSPSIKLGADEQHQSRRKGGSIINMNGKDGLDNKHKMMRMTTTRGHSSGRVVFDDDGDDDERRPRDKEGANGAPNVMEISVTPSSLSGSTEWEYEGKEEEQELEEERRRGNEEVMLQHLQSVYGKHLLPPNLSKNDRKSSGYDSLGGDESSSLDSNQDPDPSSHNKIPKSAHSVESGDIPYASPNDIYHTPQDVQIVQYDELDILRMEHRSKTFA
ncbi:uncharacterized protein LOC131887270 [Tigriopus californicus]|uniref:uncharacterized protein LOC131887270 n=1 Tax=Tigriopus californicus TaxID=6832 RepID=UPI0027DA8EE7|nr:uncharacterized protein LOC131887270 [Tigriopus californicus]